MESIYYQKLLFDLGLDKTCLTVSEQGVLELMCREGDTSNGMKSISIYDIDGDGRFDLLRLEVTSYKAGSHDITSISIDIDGGISLEKCEEEPNNETFGCKLLLSLLFGVNKNIVLSPIMSYLDPEAFAKTVKEYGVLNTVKTILSEVARSIVDEINENTVKILLETIPVAGTPKATEGHKKTGRSKGLKLFNRG